MKAKLTFNLPEDQHEWENAVNANNMYLALWEIQQEIRRVWKYGELTEGQFEIVQQIYDKVNEIINENNINLNR
jgi:hypothetical protein